MAKIEKRIRLALSPNKREAQRLLNILVAVDYAQNHGVIPRMDLKKLVVQLRRSSIRGGR